MGMKDHRSPRDGGADVPVTAGSRVWVLESQLDEAREIAERALSGDDAI
jgi:hypothetical protein